MKAFFRLMVVIHVFLYRLTGGIIGGSMGKGRHLLLLTTTGRKTRKARTVPLGYAEDESGNPIIAASYTAIMGSFPAWYTNLKANPDLSYQAGSKVVHARAEVADGERRQQLWDRLVAHLPGYAAYQKKSKSDQPIPIITLKKRA